MVSSKHQTNPYFWMPSFSFSPSPPLNFDLKIFLQAFASAAFAFAAANAIETQERTIRLRQKLKRIFYRLLSLSLSLSIFIHSAYTFSVYPFVSLSICLSTYIIASTIPPSLSLSLLSLYVFYLAYLSVYISIRSLF